MTYFFPSGRRITLMRAFSSTPSSSGYFLRVTLHFPFSDMKGTMDYWKQVSICTVLITKASSQAKQGEQPRASPVGWSSRPHKAARIEELR
jgi:hypothetical protein